MKEDLKKMGIVNTCRKYGIDVTNYDYPDRRFNKGKDMFKLAMKVKKENNGLIYR